MKKELLTATDTWVRGLYMVLYFFVLWMAKIVTIGVVVIQFLILLVTGHPNARLTEFGKQVSVFIYHIYLFLTFVTNDKPFPFNDLPRYMPIDVEPKDTPPAEESGEKI